MIVASLLFASIAAVASADSASPQKELSVSVSVSMEDVRLLDAVEVVAREAGFNIEFSSEVVAVAADLPSVSMNATRIPATVILDALLRGGGLTRQMRDGSIVVVRIVALQIPVIEIDRPAISSVDTAATARVVAHGSQLREPSEAQLRSAQNHEPAWHYGVAGMGVSPEAVPTATSEILQVPVLIGPPPGSGLRIEFHKLSDRISAGRSVSEYRPRVGWLGTR